MSFKDIVFDPNTNSILFRSRRAGQKPLQVPMNGFVPVGAIIPICNHIQGSYNCTATTAADANGFVQCNGQTINDTSSPMHGQVIPDINGSGGDPVFLRGSTNSSGAPSGATNNKIASNHLPTHTHSISGSGNHAHNLGTYGLYNESNTAYYGGWQHAVRVRHPNPGWGWGVETNTNIPMYVYGAIYNTYPVAYDSGDHSHGAATGNGAFANDSYVPRYLSVKYIMRIK